MSATPILTYHKIAPRPKETIWPGTYVSPEEFRRHVRFLKGRYRIATVAEYLAERKIEGRIVLTFDDGTRDFVEVAVPTLGEARATVYVVPGLEANSWDARDVSVPLMSASQVAEIARMGFEIGSHTLTHADLAILDEAGFEEEIARPKREIEAITGTPCRTFCYPYGRKREAAVNAVRRARYEGAVTTEKGINGPHGDPFLLRRIAVRHDTTLPVLVYKLWRARRFGR